MLEPCFSVRSLYFLYDILKSWNHGEELKKESKGCVVGAAAWRWFGALQRRFGSSALPVEWIIIIVWVHFYSNLRHRLQRTHLRAETQTQIPLLGQKLCSVVVISLTFCGIHYLHTSRLNDTPCKDRYVFIVKCVAGAGLLQLGYANCCWHFQIYPLAYAEIFKFN